MIKDQNRIGIGECSVIPGLSLDRIDEIETKLDYICREISLGNKLDIQKVILEDNILDNFVDISVNLTKDGIASTRLLGCFFSSGDKEFKNINKVNNIGGCHFWTTNVTQNCSAESWTTQLEGRVAWRYVK